MLCYETISAETSTTSKNSKNKPRRAKNKKTKPQAVSKAVTKENLCASSKRKLEAYRARDLEPQEITTLLKLRHDPIHTRSSITGGTLYTRCPVDNALTWQTRTSKIMFIESPACTFSNHFYHYSYIVFFLNP
jgi:hypothetical protein